MLTRRAQIVVLVVVALVLIVAVVAVAAEPAEATNFFKEAWWRVREFIKCCGGIWNL